MRFKCVARRSALTFAIVLLGGQWELNAAPMENRFRDLKKALETELREKKFSGILDVTRAGTSIYRYSSDGTAENKTKIDDASVFWIGSVSKQFAAAAALKLVDRGILSLDEPLSRSIKGLSSTALKRDQSECTLAHLLHHTCGLPAGNVCVIPNLHLEDRRHAFLDCLSGVSLESKPGTQFKYSNLGYDLIGVLVATIAKMPYATFLQQEFFTPLGMKDSGVFLDEHTEAKARLIQGQLYYGAGWISTWPWLMLSPTGPGTRGASGNLFSTVAELHRWNRALHRGEVLKPTTYQRMITEALDDYGMGISVERTPKGVLWLWHNGSLTPMGWSSFVAYVPSIDVSVVGLSNRTHHTSHVMAATRSLVMGLLEEPTTTPLLKTPTPRDTAIEMIFFLGPLLFIVGVFGIVWQTVRGPRQNLPIWYAKLFASGTIACFAATLFDFFGRTKFAVPPLVVLIGISLFWYRNQLDPAIRSALRATWEHKRQRWSFLSFILTSILLFYVSSSDAKLWIVGVLLIEVTWISALFWWRRREASSR